MFDNADRMSTICITIAGVSSYIWKFYSTAVIRNLATLLFCALFGLLPAEMFNFQNVNSCFLLSKFTESNNRLAQHIIK